MRYLSLAVLLAASSASAKTAEPPVVGAKAPAFTMSSQEGKPVSLSDYSGKWVVLYFYPKDFTGGCTLEAHNFQKNLDKFTALNAVVLGVSGQSADSHKEFCTKEGLAFKLLADDKYEASKAYGSLTNLGVVKFSARNTFVIGPDGTIAKRFLKVSPGGHAAEVLAALSELQKKK